MPTLQQKFTDWDAIEREYRTGRMSVREIAEWHHLSDTAIRKRAKRDGWIRLNAAGASRPELPRPNTLPLLAAPAPDLPDAKVIVGRGHDLVLRMMDELNAVTSNQGELEEMIYDDTASDRDGRRRASMLNAISLPSRALTIKALATAAKTLADTLPKPAVDKGDVDDAQPGAPTGKADGDSWSSLLN